MRFGDYPAEYDPAKHGLYDPARYYGKPDTPFGEVKLKELGSWVGRRQKSPQRFMQMVSRAFWRWQHGYVQPKRTGIVPLFQVAIASSIFFYFLNYPRLSRERSYKYH